MVCINHQCSFSNIIVLFTGTRLVALFPQLNLNVHRLREELIDYPERGTHWLPGDR